MIVKLVYHDYVNSIDGWVDYVVPMLFSSYIND